MAQNDMPKQLGRYSIVRELGKGAMGVVYEGLDPAIGRRVAIKTARQDLLEGAENSAELMERFLREARAAGGLSHPNIVTIYDVGQEDGLAYIAMEFLEGEDLREVLISGHRPPVNEAVAIIVTLCEAIGHAHGHGVIHRDLKPANIMRLTNGVYKVTDFGLARTNDSSLTKDGAMLGTPYYMSPEQFMGQQVDARSDLFALGVIAYELLTGERPFSGAAVSTVMHNVLRTAPPPLQELNFSVGEVLNQVVLKAMSKNPNGRYCNGEEMAAALGESLKPHPDPSITKTGAAQGIEQTLVTQPTGDMDSTRVGGDTFTPSVGGAAPSLTQTAMEATAIPGVGADPLATGSMQATRPMDPSQFAVTGSTTMINESGASFSTAIAAVSVKRSRIPLYAAAAVLLITAGFVFLQFAGAETPYWGSLDITLQYAEAGDIEVKNPLPATALVTIYSIPPEGQGGEKMIWEERVTGAKHIVFSRDDLLQQFRIVAEPDEREGFLVGDDQVYKDKPVKPGDAFPDITLTLHK